MTDNTNTQQNTDTKRAGARFLTGGKSRPNTTYSEKLALDARSQLSHAKKGKKRLDNGPGVKRNSDENSVYSAKLAIDSRSRKTRTTKTKIAAVEETDSNERDINIAENEIIVNPEENTGITLDIEAAPGLVLTSQQYSTPTAVHTTTQRIEVETQKSRSDLVVAYTVDEDDDSKCVFVAEPVKEEEGKKWRRIAIGLLLCLIVGGATLGIAIPLSMPGRLPASEAPSVAPTGMPSTAPTESPAPSSAPSSLPTIAPTADFCAVSYNITCRELETQKSCPEFLEELLEDQTVGDNCRSDPLEIKFAYFGGSCNNTWTEGSVTCVDYSNGPPRFTESDEPVRIVIESTKTPRLVYFDGLIAPGGEFTLTGPTHPDPIKDNLNVSIYSTIDDEGLLQSIQIPFDCTEGHINLLDRYGAVLFTGFTSVEQGQWTGFDSLDLSEYTMVLSLRTTNDGVSTLDLDSLVMSSTAEIVDAAGNFAGGIDAYGASFFNFTEKAQSQGSLEPNESFAVDIVTNFHVNEMRSLLVNLGGETAARTPCNEVALLNYTLSTPSSVEAPEHGGFS